MCRNWVWFEVLHDVTVTPEKVCREPGKQSVAGHRLLKKALRIVMPSRIVVFLCDKEDYHSPKDHSRSSGVFPISSQCYRGCRTCH